MKTMWRIRGEHWAYLPSVDHDASVDENIIEEEECALLGFLPADFHQNSFANQRPAFSMQRLKAG